MLEIRAKEPQLLLFVVKSVHFQVDAKCEPRGITRDLFANSQCWIYFFIFYFQNFSLYTCIHDYVDEKFLLSGFLLANCRLQGKQRQKDK